jgi:hypothetical protein
MDDSLDIYLQTEYREDKSELNQLDRLIQDVWPVFPRFRSDTAGWPYEIGEPNVAIPGSKHSVSTNAMVLFILARCSVDFRTFFNRGRASNLLSCFPACRL